MTGFSQKDSSKRQEPTKAAQRMKWMASLGWRGFSIGVLYLLTALALQGVHSQPIECYSCTDQGEGGCLPENAANVSCTPGHDVCLETISAIQTSHKTHMIVKKGCGIGYTTRLDKTMSFHGITVFIEIYQCNSSFCNREMYLEDYHLAPEDNTTYVPNNKQCYSCIGKAESDCSASSSPVSSCYDTYTYCFDGNFTMSIDDDTTSVPIKSCSTKYRCAVQTLTYGSANFEIKGACCSGKDCNHDLSDHIQLGVIPYLVLLPNDNEVPMTDAPPPWINVTSTKPQINVTSAKPQNNVTSAEPQINATSAEPQINVTSAEPQINATSAEPQINATSAEPQINATSAEPQINATSAEPQINAIDVEPHINATSAEPQINATSAEPQINATSTEPQMKVTPTQPHSHSTMFEDNELHVPKSTMASHSSNYPLNADTRLTYSPWALILVLLL